MARKRKSMDRQIADWANSLTAEQACRLIDIAAPLTDEERAKFDAMTDDELLGELLA